jgi:hypothetical protein
MSLEGGNRRPSVSRVKGRRRGLADRVAVGRGGADVREFASFAGMRGGLRLRKRAYWDAAARPHSRRAGGVGADCSAQACGRGACGAHRISTLSAGQRGCTHVCRAQQPPAPLLASHRRRQDGDLARRSLLPGVLQTGHMTSRLQNSSTESEPAGSRASQPGGYVLTNINSSPAR